MERVRASQGQAGLDSSPAPFVRPPLRRRTWRDDSGTHRPNFAAYTDEFESFRPIYVDSDIPKQAPVERASPLEFRGASASDSADEESEDDASAAPNTQSGDLIESDESDDEYSGIRSSPPHEGMRAGNGGGDGSPLPRRNSKERARRRRRSPGPDGFGLPPVPAAGCLEPRNALPEKARLRHNARWFALDAALVAALCCRPGLNGDALATAVVGLPSCGVPWATPSDAAYRLRKGLAEGRFTLDACGCFAVNPNMAMVLPTNAAFAPICPRVIRQRPCCSTTVVSKFNAPFSGCEASCYRTDTVCPGSTVGGSFGAACGVPRSAYDAAYALVSGRGSCGCSSLVPRYSIGCASVAGFSRVGAPGGPTFAATGRGCCGGS